MKKCQAEYIEKLINDTADGEICKFPKGEYYVERYIYLHNRTNLTIDGSGSTIVGHFNNGNSEIETTDIFHIFNCSDIKLLNFTVTTDCPVNMTGIIKEINLGEEYYIVKVLPKYNVTGKEIFLAQNACDDEKCFVDLDYYCPHPDKNKITLLANEILLASSFSSCPNEYLGNWEYKVYLPKHSLESISVGQKVCIRQSSYGSTVILIKNTKNTTISNFTIHSCGGMGIIVLPRSENLHLNNFNMYSDDPDQLMSGNCDGIHITGLMGQLVMENCFFDGLGDDALNIHSIAATVTAIDGSSNLLKCNYCKKTNDGILSPDWCDTGDVINILDKNTCKKKGSFKVIDFSVDRLKYEDLVGVISQGDILQNISFAALVIIKNCTIKRTRARACVLQTEKIAIFDCFFYGMSSAAIKVAPDVVRWYEVGPIKELSIQKNAFVKCAFAPQRADEPVICLQDNHGRPHIGVEDIHESVKILGNKFINKSGRCIFLTSTNKVEISGNCFINCSDLNNYKTIDCTNCKNVEIVR